MRAASMAADAAAAVQGAAVQSLRALLHGVAEVAAADSARPRQ